MPLNAFIVRPFAIKELLVTSEETAKKLEAKAGGAVIDRVTPIGETKNWKVRVNFDAVDRLLVRPALERLRIQGETATAVVVAGNIREDMFNRLITADLVIADLSIHNPNVFYELGIRQAFRDKYTFLIRCDLSEYPFDLKTDRYFEYSLIDLIVVQGDHGAAGIVDALADAGDHALGHDGAGLGALREVHHLADVATRIPPAAAHDVDGPA